MKTSTLLALSTSVTVSLLYTSDRTAGPAARVTVVTEAGRPLPSLFYGLPARASVKDMLRTVRPTPECLKDAFEATLWTKLRDTLQLKTVHASFCQPGGCNGSYFVDNELYCGGAACSDGSYDYPVSSGDGDPSVGYQYLGGVDCYGCVCLQSTCAN